MRNEKQYETKIVFDNERISIGQYRCWPDSHLWRQKNRVGSRAELAFPRHAVSIRQDQKSHAVASPNEVVLYDAFSQYTREPIDPRGDLCEVFAVEPEIMEEIVAHANLPSSKSASRLFGDAIAPCTSRHYLLQRSLFLHVRSNRTPDPVFVEESVLSIIKKVLCEAADFYYQRGAVAKKKTSFQNRELTEAAAEYVSRNHRNPVTLKQIANHCGCSVFHLSHVFKANKGIPVYQYLLGIRLRTAISEIREENRRKCLLNRIASNYCFASHSHFTSSFLKQFGVTPSQFRDMDYESMLRQN